MEDTERPDTDKNAQARTFQACERCRTLKTRCLPTDRADTCQRCLKSKRDCVWADTPRRKKRVRGPSRIVQVEQKLDGLVATLSHSDAAGTTPASSLESRRFPAVRASQSNTTPSLGPFVPGSWVSFPTSSEQRSSSQDQFEKSSQQDAEPTQQYLEKLREIHDFGDNDLSQPPNGFMVSSQKTEPGISDERVKNLLDTGEADDLLNEYRSMSASFPFVPLEPTTSACDLYKTKPLLFLAIVTVASWKDHKRQMALDRVYRTELANRTIIRPRKTLSLLQSILVYLSRYHFVFSHKTQQLYTLQQLAIGMALDFGLHQRYKRSLAILPNQPPPRPTSDTEQRERQRTYLGCYYLSSMVASGLQKPNLLRYTDYMTECSKNLKHSCEYTSDTIIGHLVSLRRLDDQIHDSFFSEETIDLPLTDPRILMNFRFMESQLDERRNESYSGDCQHTIELSSSYTDMQLHSIALRSPDVSTQSGPTDSTQLNALLATLEACKRYLDALLAFPTSEYHLITFSEWMRLPSVIVTLARLCIPSDTLNNAQWDVKMAHGRARLDLYLESLCYRMQGLSSYDKVHNFLPDFWYIMRMIMDSTKSWFVQKIKPRSLASTQPSSYGLPTPETINSSNQQATEAGPSVARSMNGITVCPQAMLGDIDVDAETGSDSHDPFGFMRNPEFDLDKFFDAGLWGDETYVGMGFGDSMRF